MTKPYLFGFPSSIKGISFPGKPRILTVECNSGPCPPGNFSYNGEGFIFSAQQPVGPANIASEVALIPGVAGPLGLPTFKTPPAAPPVIVTEFSSDMTERLYAWEQPVPGYISSDQTIGAAVLFLDMDNVARVFNNPKSFQFFLQTSSHGTSTPVPPPELNWYIYWTGLGQAVDPQAIISATENVNTQSFLDVTGTLPGTVDPTSPDQVSAYGRELGAGGCMSFQWKYNASYQFVYGVPLPGSASSKAAAQTIIANLVGLGIPVGYLDTFPWAIANPYPGEGFCSWNFTVKSWRRANNFLVNADGTLGNVTIVGPKGQSFHADPLRTIAASSRGANGPACLNIISVNPATMQFIVSQKFS